MAFFSLGSYYGIDSIIDLLIVVTSLLVFFQARKIYRITKDRSYNFFSISFLTIGIAFLFKTIANLTVAHEVIITQANFLVFIFTQFESLEYFYFFSVIIFKVLVLIGFISLFLIFNRTKNIGETIILFYFGIIAIALSVIYNFIFHLSLVLILMLICTYFYENYQKKRSRFSYLLLISFILILTSNVVSLFLHLDLIIYLIAEVIMFIGFMIIFFVHLDIKNGKKKNQARNN